MANDFYSWVSAVDELSDAGLTVRAQALPPDDRDRLVHPIFFPPQPVDSVKLANLLTTDFRPAADRREWNARGRLIPTITPTLQELEMVPVESYFKLAEREMQALIERTLGNESLIRQIIGVDIPTRTDGLVRANERRMEFDAFEAWALGTITAMNPGTGTTTTVSYGFDVGRYQTASPDWATATNAYNEFLAWVNDGVQALGTNPVGVVMRRSTYDAIIADAPPILPASTIALTRSQFEERVRQDLGFAFTFYLMEHRLDRASGGGLTFTRENVWPAETVALVPPGVVVGDMARAPVARAFQLARVHQDAQIDVRGMGVFREVAGNGRELTVECQINAFPRPNQNNLWVINAGV